MARKQVRNLGSKIVLLGFLFAAFSSLNAQAPTHYQPTLESLNQHPLPEWYQDAKLGIFIHWGLYSVPGWAPVGHGDPDFSSPTYLENNPYAEWYYNTMRIAGSPTQAYHREHYGADYNYYNFAPIFDRESRKWQADQWARIFRDAGAKYVVLTTKHHEGYTLWPSSIPNPTLPKDRQHATRDLVGELTDAVRKEGLKMGLYYSGGFDWTFVPGPASTFADFEAMKPQNEAYGKYANAQIHELIQRYHPAVLWNDIDWPKTGQPLEVIASYYNAVPDGVVDDRFGVKHSDYTSPEYSAVNEIKAKKWEECRGLGRSFGYNRAEGQAETLAPDALIYMLVDIVSKNGNLLLDVGPEADGTIPPIQLERLKSLGAWLKQNGDAIYGTHPWKRANGKTSEGIGVRFTQKAGTLYATLLGEPKGQTATLESLPVHAGAQVHLLGYQQPLKWSLDAGNLKVQLPPTLPGHYAYVLAIQGGADTPSPAM
jgi:alpha-L-fucosidase